jgi:phospholipid/cholesterol/gamma-HCH transport system ATP-binding protein
MASSTDVAVLSLAGVALTEAAAAAGARRLDLELARGEVALLEIGDDGDAEAMVDLCLGLSSPAAGVISFSGHSWSALSRGRALDRRGSVGALTASQVWPLAVSVAETVLLPILHHSDIDEDEIVHSATVLARRFGLPGLPVGRPEAVPPNQLAQAACVRAFIGRPELVVICDFTLESMGELAVAMAQTVGEVQTRGGAVLWIVDALSAPAARHISASHVLRLGDRGFVPVRRIMA